MTSKKKLRETLEYIRSLEEKAKSLYDDYLTRVKDPGMLREFIKFRDEEAGHVQITEELLRMLKKYESAASGVPRFRGYKVTLWMIYFAIGVVLGLGAPLGSLVLKIFSAHTGDLAAWVHAELGFHRWYYLYMTVGTVVVFSLAGLAAGIMHEKLQERTVDLTVKTRLLEDLSEKDSLTGLYNFGYVRQRLAIEMERSRRFQTPLSCLMLDLDNLKKINDQCGHPAGDAAIAHIAQIIQKDVRVIDTATRYGGDEFFVILPVTPKAGAFVVAERIRKKIEGSEFKYNDIMIRPTISVGTATFPDPEIQDLDGLIDAADQALYQAKRQGRNETIVYAAG